MLNVVRLMNGERRKNYKLKSGACSVSSRYNNQELQRPMMVRRVTLTTWTRPTATSPRGRKTLGKPGSRSSNAACNTWNPGTVRTQRNLLKRKRKLNQYSEPQGRPNRTAPTGRARQITIRG